MKQSPHTNNANLKQYADRLKAEHPFVYSSTASMEHCIVYFSSSISLFQEADLVPLLQQSRHANALAGISGVLLINQGSIVQVLEGNREVIETLYQRIKQDPRHTDVIKVVDVPIGERSFVGWGMHCKTITSHQLELIRTIVDLGQVDWLLTKPSTNSIVNMLKSAYQSDFHYSVRVVKPEVPNLLHNHIQEWKKHYRQLHQAMQAIENENQTHLLQPSALSSPQLPVSQEQRIAALLEHFESTRLLIWERHQRELSQQYVSP